jgi:transposase
VARIICGVDVSSTELDARIGHDGLFGQFQNTPEGVKALAEFCAQHNVELVVMEATGGYEKQPFQLLWARGVPAAIANPRSVRRFAEAMGWLEKTDRIDAGVIAWYAETKGIKAMPPAPEIQNRLTALVTRLGQLINERVAQNNQRRLVADPLVLESFTDVLAAISRQIRRLETEIAGLIEEDPLWRRLDEAFRSVKGVADRTVARIMALLPEIGLISGKGVSKLVGLAPLARDSGKSKGKRPVRGGRRAIRANLFVITKIVCRYDPDFAAFQARLTAAGKPKKVIRVALAHKLLVRLNAKAREVRQAFAAASATTVA